MSLSVGSFGETREGVQISRIVIKNRAGMSAALINFGAAVQSLCVRDKSGAFRDVCLGYNSLREYEDGNCFFGASIGRYANRIAGSRITVNGAEYVLTANEGKNQLHGGNGFDKKVFDFEVIGESSVVFRYTSRDGEEGFPGLLKVSVTYTLTEDNALKICCSATSDKDTVVNLTNHSYFNLNGEGSGDILGHELKIFSSAITQIDGESIPTGKIIPVSDTAFDFGLPKKIGRDIGADDEQLKLVGGYDHNYVLTGDGLKVVAELRSEESGIGMTLLSTMPGVQFYSGNSITDCAGKTGNYSARFGLCLEAQYYPDSPNKPQFPSPILKRGEEYDHTIIFDFGAK